LAGLALILVGLLFQAPPVSQQAPVPPQEATSVSGAAQQKTVPPEFETGERLLTIRRIYVDEFGDDAVSKQIHGMVINAISASKKFIVTENKDRADAVIKGSGIEQTSQEYRAYGEATAVESVSIQDSRTSTETIQDARLAVRLVDREGDVIWTTTQESKGAKYKGASADVADKIVKQLLRDVEKAEKTRSASQPKG
jgi:hypothetical protein